MKPTSWRRGVLFRALAVAALTAAYPPQRAAGGEAVPAPVPPAPAAPAPAGPGVLRLTLGEAKELAVRNNKALALARLNVAERGYAADAARKDYLPKVLGIDTYFHFDRDLGSVVSLQRGRLGLLPPGALTTNVAVFNQNSNLASVMVAQPITKLIAVNAAVQAARADQGVAQAQLDKGARDLLSGVAQAYYGLLGAQRIQSALGLQADLLEQAFRIKPAPELRVALVETRQGLVRAAGQVRELTRQLDDLLDLPPGTALELADPVPGDLPPRSADEAAEQAAASSPEVREAQEGVAKAAAAMKLARMAYVPDVSVVGGYANQTVTGAIQPNFGFVGVTASYTFFEWGKRGDVRRQREMDLALAHQNVRVTLDKVRLEARKAFDQYEQAREEYRLAGEMVAARQEAEKAAAGAAAAQAKADRARAELEYLKAEIAYRVAHAQLAGVIGWEGR